MNIPHKYNLGVIGNCSYIAYIDRSNANVKWLSFPRFDSSCIFGSLLDEEKGGEFSITPVSDKYSSKQYYIENTNILCTEFESLEGSFRVIDAAPRFFQYDRYYKPLLLARKIEVIKGRPVIKVKCSPIGEYGTLTPEALIGSNHIRYMHIGNQVRLMTNIPISTILNQGAFVLTENKHLAFSYGIPLEAQLEFTIDNFIDRTKKYWLDWVKTMSIPYFHQQEIIRSALVLKIHQYEDTGGIIASGTTSLPEIQNAGRNWDYRYCWIRDAYYSLNALNNIGHFEELEKYFQYIENIVVSEKHRIQPLYSITGEKILTETEIPLSGYLGNKPVRIGNQAYTHIQNDVYGQLLVSLLPIYLDKRLNIKSNRKTKEMIYFLLDCIEMTIDEKDAGIWEFRDRSNYYCNTQLFHWAGSKAAYKIGESFSDDNMKAKASLLQERASIRIEKCYNPKLKAYTQAEGIDYLDASCLQLISMNYLSYNSQRAKHHLVALEKDLKTDEGLFYRYKHEDDFGKPQTTFLICAFWYIEALACVGRVEEAIQTFEKLLSFSNHLGIFSEDVDIYGGQWGNFPQTYSHVGLMNAAFRISRKLDLPIFF